MTARERDRLTDELAEFEESLNLGRDREERKERRAYRRTIIERRREERGINAGESTYDPNTGRVTE